MRLDCGVSRILCLPRGAVMVSYFRVGIESSLLWSGLIVSWHSRYDNYVNHTLNPFSGYRRKQSGLSHFSQAFHPLSLSSKILKFSNLVSDMFELRLLTFVFDSVKKTSPECFHIFFVFNSSVNQYCTRQASQGDLYLTRQNSLQYGLKSLRDLVAKLCNALPAELRNAP